jgi:hypothetical protein
MYNNSSEFINSFLKLQYKFLSSNGKMFPGFACSQGKRDRQALVDLSKETVHTNHGNCSTIGKKQKQNW